MRSLSIALIAFCTLPWGLAQERTAGQWEVFEIEMTAQRQMADPYVEGLPDRGKPLVQVVFTGLDGEARKQRYTIGGFWDGGERWRARFAPPAPGDWSYESRSNDPGLDGVKGTLRATAWNDSDKQANPARHGFLHVARNGRHFEYADGTPFLWIGDTWWAWGKKGIHFESFRKLADDRAAKGFTIGQLYFAHGWMVQDGGRQLDLNHIREVERFIAYANSKGITVWIHPWWSGKGLSKDGPEKIRRWWRYVIHRLGAYNVIWVLAGEYNMDDYGGLGLGFWKDLGAMIRAEDPYRRLIGAHPTPPGWRGGADAPQWSTGEVLNREKWLDYNQSQVGHGKWRNEMIPQIVAADYARKPAKPVVVTEPWYEFIKGNPSAQDVRFAAWSAILSGAAGHTYGGGYVWWANVPEAPSDQGSWPREQTFDTDTLDYPGAVSMSFLARFLKSARWWEFAPHPELVTDYPARYCAAIPGREYVAYVRYGGTLKIDLRPSSGNDAFRYVWTDLETDKDFPAGNVKGGGLREFHTPEDYPRFPQYKDWLLHVVRGM